jgi:hypothetical protein
MDIFLYSILALVAATLAFLVYKLIRLHGSISSYRSYWLKRQDQPGDFVYVALGDSAAQAVGAKRPYQNTRYRGSVVYYSYETR